MGQAALPLSRIAALAALLLWAALLILPTATPASAGEGRIVIGPAAVVNGRDVLLRDVARPEDGLSDVEWRPLGARKILEMPADARRSLALQRDKLREALVQALGPEAAGRCLLPDQLQLQQGGRVLLEPELRRIVVDFLTPFAASFGGEQEMRDLHLPSHFFLQDSSDRLEILPQGDLAPGRVSLRLAARSPDGKVYRQATASLFLDIWLEVPCAGRPLNAGELLTPEAVTFRRKNLGTFKGALWDGKSGPFRIKRAIGAGQPLVEDLLERPPVISKSDKVTLVYEGKFVQLQVQAQALADGRAGETVPVRNLQSHKEVLAVVRDQQTVVVR